MEHQETMETMNQATGGEEAQQREPQAAPKRERGDRIDQMMRVIKMIEEILDDGKKVPMTGRYMLDADGIRNMLSQLRTAIPDTVVQAQQVLNDSAAIRAEAEQMLSAARFEANQIADQAQSIYQQTDSDAKALWDQRKAEIEAYTKQAVDGAQREAADIVADAKGKAEQILYEAQEEAKRQLDAHEITRRANNYAQDITEEAQKQAANIYHEACVRVDKMLSGATAALTRSANEMANKRDELLNQQFNA